MTLDEYLSRPGAESMAAFARALNVNADQVRQWRHGTDDRRPSARYCVAIEWHTRGQVTCEEMRPDLGWVRIEHDDWTWGGKPCLDVMPEAA